jgi:hypothetical protein
MLVSDKENKFFLSWPQIELNVSEFRSVSPRSTTKTPPAPFREVEEESAASNDAVEPIEVIDIDSADDLFSETFKKELVSMT